MKKKNTTVTHTLLLIFAAMIWGFAFVSQSVGAEYVGAFTFIALRNWIAVVFLIPVIAFTDRSQLPALKSAMFAPELLRGGIICGIALFAASLVQQVGISYTTTARASFITALYMVIVPVFSGFLGNRPSGKIWGGILLGLIGLWLLCIKAGEGFGTIGYGDLLMLLAAALFSIQILSVNHFVCFLDGVKLAFWEMFFEALIATVPMIFFDRPTFTQIQNALPAILYAGVMSSGVAYTLQIVGQKDLDPSIASLAMCLESVFGAIGGWLILSQRLSLREIMGCALMFLAIIISELPDSVFSKITGHSRKKSGRISA